MNHQYNDSLANIYDNLNQLKKYQQEIEYVLKYVEEGARILDVGCGTGTHSKLLSKLGHECVGIDPSSAMIKIANKDNNTDAKFYHSTIQDFSDDESFDVCISLFNVINHVMTLQDLQVFFKNVLLNLEIDGLFIFDCFNDIAVIHDRPSSKTNKNYKITSRYDPFTSIMQIHYEGKNNFSLRHKIWSISILEEMLVDIGFKVEYFCRNTTNCLSENDYKATFICRRLK